MFLKIIPIIGLLYGLLQLSSGQNVPEDPELIADRDRPSLYDRMIESRRERRLRRRTDCCPERYTPQHPRPKKDRRDEQEKESNETQLQKNRNIR